MDHDCFCDGNVIYSSASRPTQRLSQNIEQGQMSQNSYGERHEIKYRSTRNTTQPNQMCQKIRRERERERKTHNYGLRAVRRIVDRYGFERRKQFLGNGARVRDKRKIVPFKTPFSEGLSTLGIESIARSIASDLCSDTRAKLRIIVCYTASKNLFRIRYGRFK